MDVLLLTFAAALLAEWGDKTQLLAAALAARYAKPGTVLAGIALAALANALIAGLGGTLVHDMITLRAISLLVGVALLFAGAGGFIRQKRPEMGAGWKTGALVTTAVCFFLLEFGDKTQFMTFGLAAQYDSALLAAAGATAGVVLASVPAVVLGDRLATALPLRAIRMGVAALFLLAGFVVAINALRLV